MKGSITPPLEIMLACSEMLDELYVFSENDTCETQGHGNLLDDHRGQLIGYLGELVDDRIYRNYGYKTSFYETCEEAGNIAFSRVLRVCQDHIFVKGVINTSDTGCDVIRGGMMLMEFIPYFITEILSEQIDEYRWRISFKMDLEMVSEYMMDKAGFELDI